MRTSINPWTVPERKLALCDKMGHFIIQSTETLTTSFISSPPGQMLLSKTDKSYEPDDATEINLDVNKDSKSNARNIYTGGILLYP